MIFMNLIKITDLTNHLGISSRSLRYYEQMGLIQSVRPDFEKYRYYDAENIELLKQIMVLRKMQIPIKDIIRIYQSQDMSVVVEAFVNRIDAIDEEVNTLFELKCIVNEFLQTMIKNGINKISALPLLYDEMNKQLESIEEHKPGTYEKLSAVSDKLQAEINLSIIDLPSMRMLSSKHKNGNTSDPDGFTDWLMLHDIPRGIPGRHELFEYQDSRNDTIILQKVEEEFKNNSPYADIHFDGGLFAVGSGFIDEDIGAFHRAMLKSFDENKYYKVDYLYDGRLRHETLVESVFSPDDQREKVEVFLPVKKRMPDSSLYNPNEQIYDITLEEIESANPILWSEEFPIDGEREYLLWTSLKIATDIHVKYPFRVDINFRIDKEKIPFYSGAERGISSVRFEYGNEIYGINMGNGADYGSSSEAIAFHQPIIGDYYSYPKLGRIKIPEDNYLTWIVGEKHFAVIINNEVRYCGIHFPYMKMDLALQAPHEIIVASRGLNKVYFRKIMISQLKATPKINLKKGEISMITKQSNNALPDIRGIINGMEGKNYALNDCMAFLVERLEEPPKINYWTFTGITGDGFTMVYNKNKSTFCEYCVSGYLSGPEYISYVFDAIGYEHTYVTAEQINANKTMYLQTLMAYIDRGVPVIVKTTRTDTPGIRTDVLTHFLFVGYEDYGKTLLFLWEDKATLCKYDTTGTINQDWIFVGEKKCDISFDDVVRNAVIKMPHWLTLPEKNGMFFGAKAYRAWADDIENGRYESETDLWSNYSVYICNMATNSGGASAFLDQVKISYPQYTDIINKIAEQYTNTGNGEGGLWKALEDLGGGFNVTPETIQDKEKRTKIATKIREAAMCLDNVLDILSKNLNKKK